MNDTQIGGMDNIVGKNISCVDGNSAVQISPHAMKNGVVYIDGVTSVGCSFAVRIDAGFISTKYSAAGLDQGTFSESSHVKNVDATFGTNAQLKSKHYKYIPAQLTGYLQKTSEDGESTRGPSIAAVLNDAKFTVTLENVTAHGFDYNPPIVTEVDGEYE